MRCPRCSNGWMYAPSFTATDTDPTCLTCGYVQYNVPNWIAEEVQREDPRREGTHTGTDPVLIRDKNRKRKREWKAKMRARLRSAGSKAKYD